MEFFEAYSQHSYSEIIDTTFDPSIEGGGVLRMAIHPVGTVLCQICGEEFSSELKCCPKMMALAIEFAEEAWNTAARTKRERLLDFVERNAACFEEVVANKRRENPDYKVPDALRELT